MKKLFIAAFIFVSTYTSNTFAEVKIGIILGFTGPIESLTPQWPHLLSLHLKKLQNRVRY